MLNEHGECITVGHADDGKRIEELQAAAKAGRYRRKRGAKISDFAVMSCKEAARILHARGVLKSDDSSAVSWLERNAFRKIRKAFPELLMEVER